MKKEPAKITLSELMKELDKYRYRRYVWTKEMDKLLMKARDNKKPVSYEKLVLFWAKLGWPPIGEYGLKSHYRRIRQAK